MVHALQHETAAPQSCIRWSEYADLDRLLAAVGYVDVMRREELESSPAFPVERGRLMVIAGSAEKTHS